MSKKQDKWKFHTEHHMDYSMRTGEIGDLMKRYGVGKVHFGHPDGRSGKPNRTYADVDRDIATAMRKDYDTRRTMEAAAMAGNEDAKKYAKKGVTSDNFLEAYDTLQGLQKKYGDKNIAGTTFAAVNADRDALTKKFTAMSPEDQEKGAKGSADTNVNVAPSPEVQAAKERVAAYQASNRGTEPSPYGNYAQRSTKFF